MFFLRLPVWLCMLAWDCPILSFSFLFWGGLAFNIWDGSTKRESDKYYIKVLISAQYTYSLDYQMNAQQPARDSVWSRKYRVLNCAVNWRKKKSIYIFNISMCCSNDWSHFGRLTRQGAQTNQEHRMTKWMIRTHTCIVYHKWGAGGICRTPVCYRAEQSVGRRGWTTATAKQ